MEERKENLQMSEVKWDLKDRTISLCTALMGAMEILILKLVPDSWEKAHGLRPSYRELTPTRSQGPATDDLLIKGDPETFLVIILPGNMKNHFYSKLCILILISETNLQIYNLSKY